MAKILGVNTKRKELEVAHDLSHLSQQKKIKGVDAGLTLLTGREGEEEDPSLVFLSQQQEVEAVTAKTLPHEVKSMLVQCTLNGNYDPVVAEEVTMDEAPWVQYQGLDSTQRIEESQSLDEAMVMEVEEEKEEEMEVEEQRNQWQEPAIIWSGFF
ncbi:uncharacterized protein [Typha angustifolia]|uniref:uncharacterized protein isoform X3 n=1 Tax=Typha angustifolia TaxID=59011 RepID=UPI003C30BDB3